ncbi:MAG: response regulator [bacterium]|jgi:DNA-binding NarL/FixJ family response regulator
MTPATVLIAEDHTLVREGLRMLLSLDPAIEVTGDTGNGADVLALVERLRPDLLLLDLDLPNGHGVDIAREVKNGFPETRILILTGILDPTAIRRALAAGADGYVVKHENSEELQRAIPAVISGQCYISPAVAEVVDTGAPPPAGLTPRQLEIIAHLVRGRSSQQIAATLALSAHTVRTHRQNIMEKLDLHNTAELTVWGIRNLPPHILQGG